MPTPQEAIELIKNSGGVPVLAHLMFYKKLDSAKKETLVRELKEAGTNHIVPYLKDREKWKYQTGFSQNFWLV